MEVLVKEVVAMARAAGLPVNEKQAAFHKIGIGDLRVYVRKSESGVCRRIDLSGPFGFTHPAIKELKKEAAAEKHLGRVSAQIDMAQPRELVLDAIRKALAVVVTNQRRAAQGAKQHGEAEAVPFSFMIAGDLYKRIEVIRERIEVPPGVNVSFDEALTVLLWEAVQARDQKRGNAG